MPKPFVPGGILTAEVQWFAKQTNPNTGQKYTPEEIAKDYSVTEITPTLVKSIIDGTAPKPPTVIEEIRVKLANVTANLKGLETEHVQLDEVIKIADGKRWVEVNRLERLEGQIRRQMGQGPAVTKRKRVVSLLIAGQNIKAELEHRLANEEFRVSAGIASPVVGSRPELSSAERLKKVAVAFRQAQEDLQSIQVRLGKARRPFDKKVDALQRAIDKVHDQRRRACAKLRAVRDTAEHRATTAATILRKAQQEVDRATMTAPPKSK